MTNVNKFMGILLFVVIVLLVVLVACAPLSPGGEAAKTDNGFEYRIVEIEGMTCIWVAQTYVTEYAYAGLTCDWSEYDG